MKWVWCTYVSTKDYIIPALTLGEQLKRVNSKYPLVIAMTENVYRPYKELIKKMGCIPELIQTVEYHKILQEGFLKDNRLLKTSSRVSVFDLKQYDKMVFIDADVQILTNVDELFNYPDGSMVSPEPEKGGFEGLLVFIPRNHSFGLYPTLLKNLPIMTDELFSELWFPIKSNPDYVIPIDYFHDFSAYHQIRNDNPPLKIIHFAANKPWNLYPEDELYNTEEVQSYLKLYNSIKKKANELI